MGGIDPSLVMGVAAISDNPGVVGEGAGGKVVVDGNELPFATVAFMGRVFLRVSGKVDMNDELVPSSWKSVPNTAVAKCEQQQQQQQQCEVAGTALAHLSDLVIGTALGEWKQETTGAAADGITCGEVECLVNFDLSKARDQRQLRCLREQMEALKSAASSKEAAYVGLLEKRLMELEKAHAQHALALKGPNVLYKLAYDCGGCSPEDRLKVIKSTVMVALWHEPSAAFFRFSSGCFVSDTGTILTCAHSVLNPQSPDLDLYGCEQALNFVS
jgi:hypothetical protein